MRALSGHFRGGFVRRLRHAVQKQQLARIDPDDIDVKLDELMSTEWNVYSKPCLGHTETVVNYLGRCTHRLGLSDYRLHMLEDGHVQLDYKDYRGGAKYKSLTLSGEELISRFLLDVLPRGFMRVRHFGFLVNGCRAQRLSAIRLAIEEQTRMSSTPAVRLRLIRPWTVTRARNAVRAAYGSLDELAPHRQRLDGG